MKPDKLNEFYFEELNVPKSFDRRNFLKKLGGGIIVVFCLGDLSLLKGWGQTDDQEQRNRDRDQLRHALCEFDKAGQPEFLLCVLNQRNP